MLTQLTTLAQQADGRYATPDELQFLKDYLCVASVRFSAYEKIRSAEDEIIEKVQLWSNKTHPSLFERNSQDLSVICQRDIKHILRYVSAVILIDDLNQLKNFLVWQSKIMRAFRYQYAYQVTSSFLRLFLIQILTPEESALVKPALELVEAFIQ